MRAALDGTPGVPGPVELFGFYIPEPSGNFALKGGLEWSGQPLMWTPPVQQSAPYYAGYSTGYACPSATCGVPNAAAGQPAAETYYVDSYGRRLVPVVP